MVSPGSRFPDDNRLRPFLRLIARYGWVELLLGVFLGDDRRSSC